MSQFNYIIRSGGQQFSVVDPHRSGRILFVNTLINDYVSKDDTPDTPETPDLTDQIIDSASVDNSLTSST
jgi:hypothetical protein